jgi:hypothetical protein
MGHSRPTGGLARGGSQVVNRDALPGLHDPEIDLSGSRPLRASEATEPIEPIDAYQRLVANPLLAVAMAVLAVLLLRLSLRWDNLYLFLGSIGLLVGCLPLIQFHCLDCGATGWLLSRRRHRCLSAVARWRSGQMDRWRPPAMTTQLAIWMHILAALGALGLILLVLSR